MEPDRFYLDIVAMPIGLIGCVLAAGLVSIDGVSAVVSAVAGLALILVGHVQLLSFKLEFNTKPHPLVVVPFFALMAFVWYSVIHAISVIL